MLILSEIFPDAHSPGSRIEQGTRYLYISLILSGSGRLSLLCSLNRAAEDADCWQENVTNITLESIDSALDWVLEQPMKTSHSLSSTTEALWKAMSDDDV